MFEYSFVPTGKTRRPVTVLAAALGEAVLVTSMVLVPMFFVQELPTRGLLRALMLAPVPTAPPAPPPPMLAKAIPHSVPAPRKFNADALVSPVVVPKVVAIISEAPAIEMEARTGGVPGGIPGAALPGTETGFFSSAIPLAPPPASSASSAAEGGRASTCCPYSNNGRRGRSGWPDPAKDSAGLPRAGPPGPHSRRCPVEGNYRRQRQDKEPDRSEWAPTFSGRCLGRSPALDLPAYPPEWGSRGRENGYCRALRAGAQSNIASL